MKETSFNTSDFLVIGSGLTGLIAAINLAKYGTVNLVTKGTLLDSNSSLAQGGIAVCIDEADSSKSHYDDTLTAGCDYNNPINTKILIEQGKSALNELLDMGMEFDTDATTGRLQLTREGSHSHKRIIHAGGDQTGKKICQHLVSIVANHSRINVFENTTVTNLAVNGGSCYGCYALDNTNQARLTFRTKQTLLATGGYSGVYDESTNNPTCTGDGIAIAARAGAAITDMEFVQFHPTALAHPEANGFLISEAVRGEGGKLINKQGIRFMKAIHPLAELAPRDIVSRAIYNQMERSGTDNVYLDVTHLDSNFFKKRFPKISSTCQQLGIDFSVEPIPVRPAAHYSIGGIATNSFGQTNIAGLYAAGEVAATGVHGANRLASNSLLECLVFSMRTAGEMSKSNKENRRADLKMPPSNEMNSLTQESAKHLEHKLNFINKEIGKLTYEMLGIKRSRENLELAIKKLHALKIKLSSQHSSSRLYYEVLNKITVALLIAKAAHNRDQSIGCHYIIERSASNEIDYRKEYSQEYYPGCL